MTNKVKWFANTMAGAPQLGNNWGDMTKLLDACLVDGFNLQTLDSITRTGATATATTATAHGYIEDQVVLISGADQAEYNGEFTVVAVTDTTFSFIVSGAPASPATTSGTLAAKAAPLDWGIEFTETNKRVYRNKNPQSNRPYLRVHDDVPDGYTTTWAKFARVTIAERMTDIDTFVGLRAPYDSLNPTKNEVPIGSGTSGVYGWFKWYWAGYSSKEAAAPAFFGAWLLVGDDRGFYLACNGTPDTYAPAVPSLYLNGVSDFKSRVNGDGGNTLILAAENNATANTSFSRVAIRNNISAMKGLRLLCDKHQSGSSVSAGMTSVCQLATGVTGAGVGSMSTDNSIQGEIVFMPTWLIESSAFRGEVPGLLWIAQQANTGSWRIQAHSGGKAIIVPCVTSDGFYGVGLDLATWWP